MNSPGSCAPLFTNTEITVTAVEADSKRSRTRAGLGFACLTAPMPFWGTTSSSSPYCPIFCIFLSQILEGTWVTWVDAIVITKLNPEVVCQPVDALALGGLCYSLPESGLLHTPASTTLGTRALKTQWELPLSALYQGGSRYQYWVPGMGRPWYWWPGLSSSGMVKSSANYTLSFGRVY
jgi:hypothetical protein